MMGRATAVQAEGSPNVVDRVVGFFSPRAGLTRYFDRIRLQRAYEAASPRDPWRPRRRGASPSADHAADAAVLRAKARSLVQNVPYMRAGLDGLVAETIGTGITTYATGSQKERIDELWEAWCKVCDADGRVDWNGMQALADRAMEQDGEVLIRLRPRLATDGLPVPLQLQLLEIDFLDTARMSGANSGNRIINGVEFDALGRKAAFWLFDEHPGELGVLRASGRTQSRRIPAENIIHLFNPERPGQGRGITRMAPVINRVRDLTLYEDAEIARKNQEARLGVVVSGDPSTMANPTSYGTAADPSKAAQTGDLGQLPSGGILQLPAGVNVTTIAPTPAPGHVQYVKLQLHLIAAGWGVPYEIMTGDVSEVNFSSARVRIINFRRQVEQTQWLCLVPNLIGRVRNAFIDAAELAGLLPARADNRACEHSTPKWDYVNPNDDANAELSLICGGLLTPSESLRRRGFKPEAAFAEWAKDMNRFKELGVLDLLLVMLKGRVSAQTSVLNGPGDGSNADA